MTNATPLASEQITQEDREAAADAAFVLTGCDHKARAYAGGERDSWPLVQRIARHRIAALSATHAPSGQDASQAQGEVARVSLTKADAEVAAEALENAGFTETAAAFRAALSPAPGATAQDGAGMVAVPVDLTFHPAMRQAGWKHVDNRLFHGLETQMQAMWSAMLAASPKQAEQQGVDLDRIRRALIVFAACARDIRAEEPDDDYAKFRLLASDYRRAHKLFVDLFGEEPPFPEDAHAALNAPTGAVEKGEAK